jgi:hypothetical protein
MLSKKIIKLLIVIFLCTVIKVNAQVDSTEGPFYGAFDQHKIDWYQKLELSFNSISKTDTAIFPFSNYPMGSKKYVRTTPNFNVYPAIEYAYKANTKEVQQISYDWSNYINENQIDSSFIDSSANRKRFVAGYKKFYDLLTSKLGTPASQVYNKNKDLEILDTWTKNKLTCTLELTYYDIYEKNSNVSIIPTHRVRCIIEWQ